MPILVKCDCGHEITVADTMAGKKGRCPECDAVLSIPEKSRRARRGGAFTPAPREQQVGHRALGFLAGLLIVLGFVSLFAFAISGVYTGVQVLTEAEAFTDHLGIFDRYRDAARDSTTLTGILFMVVGLGLGGLSFLFFCAAGQMLKLFVSLERSLLSIAASLTRRE